MNTKRVRIESVRLLREVMTGYYAAAKLSEGSDTKVAWVTSGSPVEIVYAAGAIPVYPENHTALCGAQRMAVGLCEAAEEAGFSRDLCSYFRTDTGATLTGKSPVGGLPKPDFLVCCNNICGTVIQWYEALADHYHCPLFILDVPFQRRPEQEEHIIAYVAAQIEALISWSEEQAGRSLDVDRLMETLELSRKAIALWSEIRDLGAHRPSPLNAPDLFLAMAPIVVLRGTQTAVDFYRLMKVEVEERVANGVAAVPGERIRLLWDNIAIWYQLFRFYRLFANEGACFVVDTYTNSWSTELELDEPIMGLARAYAAPFINLNLTTRSRVVSDLAHRFDVDGMVMHANRSCKPFSLTQPDLREMLRDEMGLPTLILEADMADSRLFNQGAIRERVSAFLEMLAD